MKHLPTFVGIVIALFGPIALAAWGDRIFGDPALMRALILGQMSLTAVAVVVLAIVLGWERMPLGSVGLHAPDWKTIASGLALAAVYMYVTAPLAQRIVAWTGLQPFAGPFAAKLGAAPRWYLVIAAINAGAVEELLYRGYAIERLAALTSSYFAAGALVTLIFSLAHLPHWGPGLALSTLISGSVGTAFYIWRRDLLANALAHALADIAGLLALSAAFHHQG